MLVTCFKNFPFLNILMKSAIRCLSDGLLSAHRHDVQRLLTCEQVENFLNLTIIERANSHGTQTQSNSLQVDVLCCMSRFHVHISFSSISIALRGSLIDGGKYDVYGTITYTALVQSGFSQVRSHISVEYVKQLVLVRFIMINTLVEAIHITHYQICLKWIRASAPSQGKEIFVA